MPFTSTAAATPNFQTVTLKRGRHIHPDHGVCVMELASMLAGERFTDQPRSVSPVIASFLRTYNDLLDDERRQDLYRLAADCVGSRASRAIEQLRAAALPSDPRMSRRARWAQRFSFPARRRTMHAARAAAYLARTGDRHARALTLVDDLIGIGAESLGGLELREPTHA